MRPIFDSRAKIAFVVAFVTLAAASVALPVAVRSLNVFLRKEPIYLREPLALIPKRLGNWQAQGDDLVYDPAVLEALGTEWYVDRRYGFGSDVLNLHIAYYTGMIDAVPHVPDRCMVAAGFNAKTLPVNLPLPLDRSAWDLQSGPVNEATGRRYPVIAIRDEFRGETRTLLPVDELELRVTEFDLAAAPGMTFYGGYFFVANGRATATPDGVRLMAFDLSQKYAYYCKVQLVYGLRGGAASSEEGRTQFLARSADLLDHLLPELMKRLPDWSAVESADPVGSRDHLALSGAPARSQ